MKRNNWKIGPTARMIMIGATIILSGSCDIFTPSQNSSPESIPSYLGKGYDAFDPYADSTCVTDSILDVSAMKKAGLLEMSREENSTTYGMSGESVSEYLSSYQVSVGVSSDYKVFSGTLRSKFGSASYSSLTSGYATYTSTIRKYKEKVLNQYNDAASLRPYVKDEVLTALDECESVDDALNLFTAYGTHVILWDYLGARVDYHATTTSSDTSFIGNFATRVSTAFKGLSTDVSYSSGTAYSDFISEASTELQIYGGPSQYANSILTGDYSTWEDGIGDSSTWTLCDFGQDDSVDSLMPIWDLCSGDDDGVDEVALLEDAFDVWADDKEVDVTVINPSSYTVKFSLDYVYCYIGDEGDHQAEFQGKLSIDGSTLWRILDDNKSYFSAWDCSEDDWVKTDTSGYVDSSDRYSSVTRTFADMEDEIILKVNSLTEIDSVNNDEFSTSSKTYQVDDIIGWDGKHMVITSSDGDNRVKFYILMDVTKNYD